jgi:hypothetical protein
MLTREVPGFGVRGDFVMSSAVFNKYQKDFYMEGKTVAELNNDYSKALVKPVIQINGSETQNRYSFEQLGLLRGTDFIYGTAQNRNVVINANSNTDVEALLQAGIGLINVNASGHARAGNYMGPGYGFITLPSSIEAMLKAEYNTNSTITANMDLADQMFTQWASSIPAITTLPDGAVPLVKSLNDNHIPEAQRYLNDFNPDSFFRAGWAYQANAETTPVEQRRKALFADKIFVASGTYNGEADGAPIVTFTTDIFARGHNQFFAQRMLGNAILALAAGIQPINPDPERMVISKITTAPVSNIINDVDFTLSLKGLEQAYAVEIEFEVDGNILYGKDLVAHNGFAAVNPIAWTLLPGGIYNGKVTLYNDAGFASAAYADIATFVYGARHIGPANMTIKSVKVASMNDKMKYVPVVFETASATTSVIPNYSMFDLNRDGVVDLLDLAIVLIYVGYDSAHPDWNGPGYKVVDSYGEPILASKCDVAPLGGGDNKVDMADVLEVYINYT